MEEIGLVKSCPPSIQEEREPQNAREWGLLHEKSVQKAYQRVASWYAEHAEHAWFDPKDAEGKRTLTKTYWKLFFSETDLEHL